MRAKTPDKPGKRRFICQCGCNQVGYGRSGAKYLDRNHKNKAKDIRKVKKRTHKTQENDYYMKEIMGILRSYYGLKGELVKSHLDDE